MIWAEPMASGHLAAFRAEEAKCPGQIRPVFRKRFNCRLGRREQGLDWLNRRVSEGR